MPLRENVDDDDDDQEEEKEEEEEGGTSARCVGRIFLRNRRVISKYPRFFASFVTEECNKTYKYSWRSGYIG